jgi:hypothetical protein
MRSHRFSHQHGAVLSWILLITLTCLTPGPAQAQTITQTQGTTENHPSGHHMMGAEIPNEARAMINTDPQSMSAKQKLSIVHANFERSKSDAAELATLAKELRAELDKPNVNVLSLEVMNRIEKIQKLAKRIRDETKGF